MIREWAEVLPPGCPPEDAYEPDNLKLYRLVKGNPPTESDFHSAKLINPIRFLRNSDECHARSTSLFGSPEGCERQKKYSPLKNCIVAEIILPRESGLIEPTYGNGHYSWWRSRTFNPVDYCTPLE